MPSSRPFVHASLAATLLACACRHAAPAPSSETYNQVPRLAVNSAAVRLNLPLFWATDRDQDGAVDPDEVASLLFYGSERRWVEQGAFTTEFEKAYGLIVGDAQGALDVPPEDYARRKALALELDQGRPTLIQTDLKALSEGERVFVRHMRTVAGLMDALFSAQQGLDGVRPQVAPDPASQAVFRRNWGPACLGPKTEKDPACSAVVGGSVPPLGIYPASLQVAANFCEALDRLPNTKELLDPFTVVRAGEGGLVAVGYHQAFQPLMQSTSAELRAAAAALPEDEAALKRYLLAAAQSFLDNDWKPADEAWSLMNAQNSKWYVRVGPDEVYWEPCSQKAAFHLTFARINTDSLEWQAKLTPVQQAMEDALAAHIGAPYQARKVTFHLPDFVDIVFNAGDDRDPFGAIIGQSLPNWGPVANEGRGRTIAMTNLYTDPDSIQARREQAASLLRAETLATGYADRQLPGLLSTILHEATHNLGPSHEYAVDGKVDTELFGGPLASTLEELKAQTGALWYVAFLRQNGIIDEALARQIYTDAFVWALGHISRGMYDPNGKPKPYSQLAAIQTGFFLEEGALSFDPEALAANGKDKGAFQLDFERLPGAIDKLMKEAGRIKATGDRSAAEALVKRFVDSKAVPQAVIAERYLRSPKASFVFSVEM